MSAFQIYVILSGFMAVGCLYLGWSIGRQESVKRHIISQCNDMDVRAFEIGIVVRVINYCDVHGNGNGKLARRKLASLRRFVRKGIRAGIEV